MRTLYMIAALSFVTGCTPDSNSSVSSRNSDASLEPEIETETADSQDADQSDSSVPDSDTAVAPALFVPAPTYEVGVPVEFTITDPARVGAPERTFYVALREPVDAPGPRPIVIISHGGSGGKSDPVVSLRRWAEFVTKLGYVSVSIAHPLRSDEEGQALCEHLDATADQCANFKFNNYDRPRDFARLVNELETFATTPEWGAKLDVSRIVYMGHSAGAGATQMVSGACRSYYSGFVGDEMFCFPDERPIGFVSLSPQGIGDDGFKEGSWVGMERPFLMGTGLGDGGPDVGPGRRDGFHGSASDNQYLLYFDHIGAQHGLFGESGVDACKKQVSESEHGLCDELDKGLRSTVAAFLFSVLMDDGAARDWLRSNQVTSVVVSAEWDYR